MNNQEFPDNFVRTLWEILHEQSATVRAQSARIQQIWAPLKEKIGRELPPIRHFKVNKERYLQDIPYRIELVQTLRYAMIDTYFVIKEIVYGFYEDYLGKGIVQQDFPSPDSEEIGYLISDILIGSLLQFIMIERPPIPLGHLIWAKNKAMFKLKPLTPSRIKEGLEKNGFLYKEEEVKEALEQLVKEGKLRQESTKNNEMGYRYNSEPSITSESLTLFNKEIKPILEWCVGIWRSLYNIRSLDTPIPDHYPYRDFLVETVKRAATQGFLMATNVMENIENYYQLILQNNLEVP